MKELVYPFTEEAIRSLKIGESVRVTGLVFTGRDRFHKFLADGGAAPADMRDGALFHCGPVVSREGDTWRVVAAGPTTSIREEPYEAEAIAKLGLRLVIGKGGMGGKTLAALKRHGCVYLQAVGGAAASIARCVRKVRAVHYLEEFGAAEACWEFEMEGFEAVVGMDADGGDLFAQVRDASFGRLKELTEGGAE